MDSPAAIVLVKEPLYQTRAVVLFICCWYLLKKLRSTKMQTVWGVLVWILFYTFKSNAQNVWFKWPTIIPPSGGINIVTWVLLISDSIESSFFISYFCFVFFSRNISPKPKSYLMTWSLAYRTSLYNGPMI